MKSLFYAGLVAWSALGGVSYAAEYDCSVFTDDEQGGVCEQIEVDMNRLEGYMRDMENKIADLEDRLSELEKK